MPPQDRQDRLDSRDEAELDRLDRADRLADYTPADERRAREAIRPLASGVHITHDPPHAA